MAATVSLVPASLACFSRPPLSPTSLAHLSLSRALDTPGADSCLYRTRPQTAATVSLTRQPLLQLPFSFTCPRHLPRPRRFRSPSYAPKRPLLFRLRAVLSRACLSPTRFSRSRPSPAHARANYPAPNPSLYRARPHTAAAVSFTCRFLPLGRPLRSLWYPAVV